LLNRITGAVVCLKIHAFEKSKALEVTRDCKSRDGNELS
jgi:hypothetical protein